ncbi:ankyrin repeat domain-containing protein [Gammaproteobacteria bacterium]|nr:ankyrin repeat domain-containing protein [Gammaproteobacteria bacterium]
MVTALLEYNEIKINHITNNGETPLCIAAQYGRLDIVKALLAHGKININQVINSGISPLFVAAQYGYSSIIESLLVKGADYKGSIALAEKNRWYEGRARLVKYWRNFISKKLEGSIFNAQFVNYMSFMTKDRGTIEHPVLFVNNGGANDRESIDKHKTLGYPIENKVVREKDNRLWNKIEELYNKWNRVELTQLSGSSIFIKPQASKEELEKYSRSTKRQQLEEDIDSRPAKKLMSSTANIMR